MGFPYILVLSQQMIPMISLLKLISKRLFYHISIKQLIGHRNSPWSFPRVCHSPLFVTFFFRKCFICSSGVLGCQGYVCFCSSICIKVPSKPIFIFILMAGVRTIIKGEKGQYLGSWATNHKTKDTLLSQTIKVEEKKVSLFF